MASISGHYWRVRPRLTWILLLALIALLPRLHARPALGAFVQVNARIHRRHIDRASALASTEAEPRRMPPPPQRPTLPPRLLAPCVRLVDLSPKGGLAVSTRRSFAPPGSLYLRV